ncbi:transposase [Roseovarius sp. D22-M7]|uniref:transposase n=1 Tax=Roseovarius sp. D22-M7 TaxID=3127116 RepID=UPI0030101B8B
MPRRHRSHSTEFKRQVVAEYHSGDTLHALGRRHDLSRNLIRIASTVSGKATTL